MDEKKPENKISTPRLILTMLVFVLAAGIIVLAAVNIRHLSWNSMVKTLRSWFGMEQKAEDFYYSSEGALALESVGGGLLVVTHSGVTLYDEYGDKLTERAGVYDAPVAVSNGSVAGVYEPGGVTLLTVDSKGADRVYEADEKLISVSVSRGGWFVLCTEEENYKGSVTVLNSQRKAVYKLYSGDGYLLNAALNDDGTRLAAIKLTAEGSQIVEYTLDSDEVKNTVTLGETVALKCIYGAYGDLSVVTDKGYMIIDSDGVTKSSYDYNGLTLGDFSMGGEAYSAVYCRSYSETEKSCITTLDDFGGVIARLDITNPVVDISANGERIAVLYENGLALYDKTMGLQKSFAVGADAEGVILLDDARAIVVGEYSAHVFG